MSVQLAITNLNFRTTIDDLFHLFKQYGELDECRLIINERNESKGYAFISYKRSRDAQEAIKDLNHFRLEGREINVNYAQRY